MTQFKPVPPLLDCLTFFVLTQGFLHKVFFFCLKEPDDGCGGETPLAKNSDILSKMDPEIVRKFEEKELQYVRYLPDKSNREYLNWQLVFKTENRKVLCWG